MKMFALALLLAVVAVPVLETTAQARGRDCRPANHASISGGKSQQYQPRSRAGGYAKPSFYQGNHKALGKH